MITLRKYVSESGNDEVEAWYSGLTTKDRAKTRVKLDYLRSSITNWAKPSFEHITSGPGKGLGEIKFRYGRVRVRLLGFFGPYGDDFTVLKIEQKSSRTLPKGAWETAQKRRTRVTNQPELAHEWEI